MIKRASNLDINAHLYSLVKRQVYMIAGIQLHNTIVSILTHTFHHYICSSV